MNLSILVAVAENGAIGIENRLPWKLSEDLKNFKKLTMGNTLIMGRKTFQSIGKALPGRENLVLSRDTAWADQFTDIKVFDSIPKLLEEAKKTNKEIFVIGGGEIYTQLLPFTNKLYYTLVHTHIHSADAFFPKLNWEEWAEIERLFYVKDEKNEYDFEIITYQRNTQA